MMKIGMRSDGMTGRRKWALLIITMIGCSAGMASPVMAQGATDILKSMSNYVGSQNSVSFTFDTEIEVVTPFMQKLQFNSSGRVAMSRPNKVHSSRTGGYADVEFVADGKVVTLLGKNANVFAQADLGGSIDAVVSQLRDRYNVELPAADLLSSDSFAALMEGVIDSKHIGRGVVDGVDCEHLAFRTIDADWQIWVQVGNQPIPRKYVITSKSVGAAPQYTIRIKDWNPNPTFAPDAFVFKAPSGAKKVDLTALSNFDEIPASAPQQ